MFLSMRNQRIDSASVWRVVKKHLKQAKIVKTRLSPHTLRHTFATTLLKQGENILTIKELMSHRNLRTTERYLHINNDDLKAAVGRIDMGTEIGILTVWFTKVFFNGNVKQIKTSKGA